MPKTDVLVQIFHSGVWNTITSDVLVRDLIRITRGLGSVSRRLQPTRCEMSIRTIDGTYSPRNAASPLYGLIGRNTPLRVFTGPNGLWLPGTAGDYASTPDTAAIRVTGNLEVRVGFRPTAWPPVNVDGYNALAGRVANASTNFSFLLSLDSDGRALLEWSTNGSTIVGELSTDPLSAVAGQEFFLKAELDVDIGGTQHGVFFSVGSSIDGPWTLIDSLVSGGTTSVFAGTSPLEVGSAEGGTGGLFNGIVSAVRLLNGLGGTEVANPDFELEEAGATSFTDDAGRVWTVNGDALIQPATPRFIGEVETWPQRWTPDADPNDLRGDAWTPIRAYGITRRMGNGGSVAEALSASYRYITRFAGAAPAAYWPMNTPASPVTGVSDMEIFDGQVGWETGQLEHWLEDGLTLATSFGVVRSEATISASDGATDLLIKGQPGNTGDTFQYNHIRLDAISPGVNYVASVLADWNGGSPTLQLVTNSGILDTDSGDPAAAMWDNRTHHWRILLDQSGANVNLTVYLDGVPVLSGTNNSITLSTSVRLEAGGSRTTLGQAAIWSGTPPSVTDAFTAAMGYVGETADERIERLCEEEGISVITLGNGDVTLGPQRAIPVLESLFEAADTDGGLLRESRETLGLEYVCRTDIRGQITDLDMDYDAAEVWNTQPEEDTDRTANLVTVTRRGGGSTTLEKTTGWLNTSDPIDDPKGVGRYPVNVEVSLEDDAQTGTVAARRLRDGTWDEPRYPMLGASLTALRKDGKDGTAKAALNTDMGGRITVSNPPVWAGEVDQFAIGYVEDIGSHTHTIEWVTIPHGPYDTKGLDLPGTSGNYASTPDAAKYDVSNRIVIEVEATPDDWSPASSQAFVTKFLTTGNQRSWSLQLEGGSGGDITFVWSHDGTNSNPEQSTVTVPFTDGTRGAVKIESFVTGGTRFVDFYTGPCVDGPWTTLGTQQSDPDDAIFSSTAPVQVGSFGNGASNLFAGVIHAIRITVDSVVVLDVRFQEQLAGTTSFLDDAGNTWTLNGSAAIV